MSVKLLTEHRLGFVSLKGGCTGSSESTLVKMRQCAVSCSSSLKLFFFMPTHEKETQLGIYVLCAKSAFVCKNHRVVPES